MTTAVGISETMCHPGLVTTRLGLAALTITLLGATGCGGDTGGSPEQEDFIVELELPLSSYQEEPEVYGQAGLSPNGRNGTRIVIRLDDPHKATMEAEVRRGGCGGFRSISADYELGKVKDGKLTTDVDVPTSDIRMGYALVVREPRKDDEEARSRRVPREGFFDKGTCGDLSSAEPVD
jgi:hypothetical protein